MGDVDDKMLTPSQVAQFCQVSRHVVRGWRLQKLLKAYLIPGTRHFRYRQSELLALLKQHDWPIPTELLDMTA